VVSSKEGCGRKAISSVSLPQKTVGGFVISNYEHQDGLPIQSVYVGSRDGNPFLDAGRQTVIDAVAASFDCFTVVDADGYFNGRSVATLIIKVATDDRASVEDLGHGLGLLLDQQVVGLETAGRYQSISMG
jgi:hypothetical protein